MMLLKLDRVVTRLMSFFSWWGTREKAYACGLDWTECWRVGKTDRMITRLDYQVELFSGQNVRLDLSIIFQSPGKPKYWLCFYLSAPVPN